MTTSSSSISDRTNQKIKETIAKARSLSEQGEARLSAVAWAEVDELKANLAKQEAEVKTNFEQYCDDHPSAVGCLIYDV